MLPPRIHIQPLSSIVILLTGLLAICSCVRQPLHEPSFSRARAVMDSCPECALAILDSIPTADLRPGLDSARYILLHALAENKAHYLTTSDSLLRSTLPIFKRHKLTSDLMIANYLLGTSLDSQERYEEAIGFLIDAENLIDDTTPPYERGLIYNGLADCCNSTLNGELALKYIDLAYQNFRSASKPLHAAYALYGKATYLTNHGSYSQAIPVFNRAKVMADSLKDTDLSYGVTSGLGYVYLAEGVTDTALYYFSKLPKDLQMADPQTLALMARTEITRGNRNVADSLARMLLDMGDYRWIYAIDPDKTNVGEIIDAYKKQDEFTNRLYMDAYHDRYPTIVERNFILHEEVSHFRSKLQRIMISILILVVTLVTIYGYILIKNYRKKISDKESALLTLSNDFMSFMRQQVDQSNQADLQRNISTEITRSMLQKQAEIIHSLVHSYYGRPHESRETLKELTEYIEKLVDDYRNNPDTIKHLEELVNLCHNNILTRLDDEIPNLRKEDRQLFCYIASSMSTHTIMRIYDLATPHMLANRKYRLKKKILDFRPPSLNEFLRYF